MLRTLKARLTHLEELAERESPPLEIQWTYRAIWPDGTIEPVEPDPDEEGAEVIEWGYKPGQRLPPARVLPSLAQQGP